MNLRIKLGVMLVLFSLTILIVQSGSAEDWLCNEESAQSWTSNKPHVQPEDNAQILITITLFIHEGEKTGQTLSGVSVVAKDDTDASYTGTTSDGYIVFKGKPGIWEFVISRQDFEPETIIEPIFVSGRVDICFQDRSQEARPQMNSELISTMPPETFNKNNLTTPYSEDFDLRDMRGFNDNLIDIDIIESFIRTKASNSPMLSEPDIAKCFLNAGQKNNVNPAFLIAIACSESGFGTKGWALKNPECHNPLGYGVGSEDVSSNEANCADCWCAMVNRVAIVIAKGNSYYKNNLHSVAQVYAKYSKDENLNTLVSLMNELYSFGASRLDGSNFQLLPQTAQENPVDLSGYRPTYKPSQSGYRPTYMPKGTSSIQDPVQLG